jgi:phosphoribosylformylglycinamidine synthase I
MKKPKVCVLRTAGTNCDQETAFAFSKAQGIPELVHINSLLNHSNNLKDFQILAIPGGFTYGDDIAAGKILANELKNKLFNELSEFIAAGKLIIGICNGFQILVKSGLLPGNLNFQQQASLTINESAKFEDRWVYLKKSQEKCVWTKGLAKTIYLPVAHGEGKFVAKDKSVLSKLKKNGQVVFQYCDEQGALKGYPYNPNGSEDNIAGICDPTGRILGLMPHPERHIEAWQHPRQTSLGNKSEGEGLSIFNNGVEYAKRLID